MTMELEQLSITANGAETLSVDEENRVIRGFVVAQAGDFKTTGRGKFDDRSLQSIVRLIQSDPSGLASYYGHAKPGEPMHRLGMLLGRAKSPRIQDVPIVRDGKRTSTPAVVADLHLSPTAFEDNPNGPIGKYVMNLAKDDPRAFGSSLVLDAMKEYGLSRENPVWRPLKLASIDVVGEGESVDAFLPSRLSTEQAAECLATDPDKASESDPDADIDLELKMAGIVT